MKHFKSFILVFCSLGYVSLSTAGFGEELYATIQKGLICGTIGGLAAYSGYKTVNQIYSKNAIIKMHEKEIGKAVDLFIQCNYTPDQVKLRDDYFGKEISLIKWAERKQIMVGSLLTAGGLCALKMLPRNALVDPTIEGLAAFGVVTFLAGLIGKKTIDIIFGQFDNSEICRGTITFPIVPTLAGIGASSGLLYYATQLAYKR